MRLASSRVKTGTALLGGFICLLLFFTQGVFFIHANSETYDEAVHLTAGYSYLARRDFRLEPQNPPLIKEFLALPLFWGYRLPFSPDPQQWRDGAAYHIGQDFLYQSTLPAPQMFAVSRAFNLLLGTALVAVTGWWACRLWGRRAAILAMTLACFEPNLVAHSSLVTTDTGATLLMFLSVYLAWEYLRAPRWWLLGATGVCTGMALVAKYSAMILLPLMALIIVLSFVIQRNAPLLPALQGSRSQPRCRLLEAGAAFFLIAFFASLAIPAAYCFQGFEPWVSGFVRFMTLAREGQPSFFLGEHSYQGWWSYYPVAFLLKTPVGSLVLIAASMVFCRAGSPLGRREAVFLLMPVAMVIAVVTQAKVNIGLRHVLAVYPFLLVLASRVATIRFRRRWLGHCVVGVPVILTAVSSLRIAPHQLAYFNEIAGGPEQGYRYLGDSNLDWGQDLGGVKAYMERENLPIIYLSYFGVAPPSYYGIRYQYVPGSWPLEWPPPADRVPAEARRKMLAISVHNLQDVSSAYDRLFDWLWQRNPVAKIGYSIFVYDLTDDREGLMKIEETYVKAGIGSGP